VEIIDRARVHLEFDALSGRCCGLPHLLVFNVVAVAAADAAILPA